MSGQEPDDTPAEAARYWQQGLQHQRQGELARAAEALRMACVLDPSRHEAVFALAWVLHDLDQLPEAVAWAERALQAERQPGRLLQLGWLRQKSGDPAAALDLYEEAIAAYAWAAPEQVRLHLHRAQCLAALGLPLRAAACLAEGLER